jgi:dTDP-4-dehydrorhamnose reductase
MKIIITGAKGQLGNDCIQVLAKENEVIALGRNELDITRLAEVNAMIDRLRPDVIVNCAAYTRVDACETEKELARKVNVTGPENLATCVERNSGLLIHISTDYVFDGKKKIPEPYIESDDPCPASYYGKTKLEGEMAVRNTTDRHVILRTAWLYGANGHNFLKTILRLASTRPNRELKVVNDQFGSPTWSYRLALQIAALIKSTGRGTYHATAESYATWYELADYFLNKMNIPHNVIPCTSDEYPLPAPRPKNSILENRRLKDEGIDVMNRWQADLDHYIAEFGDHLNKQCSM